MGYYINPLMSVALGVVVMGERLSSVVQLAVAIAAVGVAVMTFAAGKPPWISLCLAVTFAMSPASRRWAYSTTLERGRAQQSSDRMTIPTQTGGVYQIGEVQARS